MIFAVFSLYVTIMLLHYLLYFCGVFFYINLNNQFVEFFLNRQF